MSERSRKREEVNHGGGDWIPEYADRLAGVIIRADRSRTTGEVLSKLAHTRLRMHKKPF